LKELIKSFAMKQFPLEVTFYNWFINFTNRPGGTCWLKAFVTGKSLRVREREFVFRTLSQYYRRTHNNTTFENHLNIS